MEQLNLMLAITGAVVVLIGLFSNPIKRSVVQEPIIAMCVGIGTVAFSLLTLGFAQLLAMDALISVFLAGLVFNLSIGEREEREEQDIQEAVAKLFTLPMFVLFGIALPFAEWARLGWPLLFLAVLVLLLRRPPVIALLFPAMRRALNGRDTAFLAWSGPIGVAAIYYAALAERHAQDPLIWHAASALIFVSIIGYGVTAAPLTRLYSHRKTSAPAVTQHLSAS